MYRMNVEGHFSSAHFLRNYSGKCANMHGHEWRYQVELNGKQLNDVGMLLDFGEVKRVMEQFDHLCINDHAPFNKINPTAENLARYFFDQLSRDFGSFINVMEVTIYESTNCSASVCASACIS